MLLESLAKELVSVTSELVGGRTINIMNTAGIIIASTEAERIGTFHQGAMEAVQTGKSVNISRDQLPQYPGAKEGCNMPLRVSGSIIGVVGIYGDPAEIRDLAHLLDVYATKYYQLEAMANLRLAEREFRSRILDSLLHPSEASIANAVSLMESQKIDMTVPVTVAVVSLPSGAPLSLPREPLSSVLLDGCLIPKRDIWGIVNDRLVLLMSARPEPLPSLFASSDSPLSALLNDYRFSFGEPCQSLWDIRRSYEQAALLDDSSPERCNDVEQLRTHIRYLLAHTCARDVHFLDRLYDRLTGTFSKSECDTLLKTAEHYYESGRSVSRAGAALFIHKNTLQYRMRRLLDTLELADCSAFEQEYVIRLLLERHKRKHGLRAL